MNAALGIFRMQPAGGLERHVRRIADALAGRGHRVAIYTTGGADVDSHGIEVVTLPRRGHTNHGAMDKFSEMFANSAAGHDIRVGFQKMRDLDLLFCADWCYTDRPHPPWTWLLPRHRTMMRLERACFDPQSRTRILALSEPQLAAYRNAYGTPASRAVVLPPTIDRRHRADDAHFRLKRAEARATLGMANSVIAWLWIGLQPIVKGLDRVVAALAIRPEVVLLICGTRHSDSAVAKLMAKARREGFDGRIRILGIVPDERLATAFSAADLLVHPARLDVTATVILEAMAHGLPVVTTANCGFAPHVASAQAGIVVPVPFDQKQFDAALASADAARREEWSRSAIDYCADPRLYSGIARACDLIEAAADHDSDAWQRCVSSTNGKSQ
jgi:UDP-glucose:(heptosyl)LPS alpha-1,3-glucosyltransferase